MLIFIIPEKCSGLFESAEPSAGAHADGLALRVLDVVAGRRQELDPHLVAGEHN